MSFCHDHTVRTLDWMRWVWLATKEEGYFSEVLNHCPRDPSYLRRVMTLVAYDDGLQSLIDRLYQRRRSKHVFGMNFCVKLGPHHFHHGITPLSSQKASLDHLGWRCSS